jgi:hypothetical protein
VISFDHTQAQTTVGRTPLDEGLVGCRDLYVITRTLYKANIHAPRGIRTHGPSKCSAADLRFRPRGHWDESRYDLNIVVIGPGEGHKLSLFENSRGPDK